MPSSRSAARQSTPSTDGVTVARRFTRGRKHPFDAVEWEIRDAVIGDPAKPAFEQRGVEFPKSWSQNATNIVAQKYFRGRADSRRARALRAPDGRPRGRHDRRLGTRGRLLRARTRTPTPSRPSSPTSCCNQIAAFNSPVWFNVGFEEHPQCSACFILSVEDTMESILDWNTKRGQDLPRRLGLGHQPLEHPRLDGAPLQGRHRIRSRVASCAAPTLGPARSSRGGKTRRAAKMVVLDVDHPDILDFVWCKAREEEKAAALRDAGFDMSIDGDGFASIQYQNANNSVRVSSEFMERAERGEDWQTLARADGSVGGDPRCRRGAAPDRRRRVALRRSGRAVRHHHQRVAHLPEVGPDQRVQPVLGVHARGRLGLQPRLDQPHEVPPRRRHVRHRGVRAHGRRDDPRAGDRGRARRATRPRRSARTPARSASSAWATRTSARC